MAEKDGRHMYNIITSKSGKQYIIDLENDLEYIQSGAKTRYFGLSLDGKSHVISEEKLKYIDKNKAEYIKEGYYLEDMLWMLKIAIENKNLNLSDRVYFVLQNLDTYKDNSKVKYREKIRYQERVFDEIFTYEELNKIHQINCYEKQNDIKSFRRLIIVDKSNNINDVYIHSKDNLKYIKLSMKELADEINTGLITMSGIPGLKKYIRNEIEWSDR